MAAKLKYELIWTEPAVCDLERIDRYLRRRNPSAARRLGEGLLLRTQVLKTHPEIGRVYDPELPHRVLPHRNYKIFYRVRHDERMWKSPMSDTAHATTRRSTICLPIDY